MILLSILIIADENRRLSVLNPSFEESYNKLASCGCLPITEYMTNSMVLWTVKNISIQHHEMRSFSVSMWRRGPCSCCTWTRASVMGFTVLRCANSPSARSYIHGPPGFTHTHACTFGERENVWNVKFSVAKSHDLEKNMGNFTKVICSITPKHAGVN